jgi:hypothetical protein
LNPSGDFANYASDSEDIARLEVVVALLSGELRLSAETRMNRRKRTKLVHEGRYVAEVDVDLIDDDTGWAPYLAPEDAFNLDHVRSALRRGDLHSASNLARVFELRPVVSR